MLESFCPCLGSGNAQAVRTTQARSAKPSSPRDLIVSPRPPVWESSELAAYGSSLRTRLNLRLRRHIEVVSRFDLSRRVSRRKSTLRCEADALELRLGALKAKQRETLDTFTACEANGDWSLVHYSHFDWWMFPIDDGSKEEYNLRSEDDVASLRFDQVWLDGYREAVRLAAAAWGWNVAESRRIDPLVPSMKYTARKDVRLFKICRSLYIFEETELLASMQAFAREVQMIEKGGRQFTFKGIVLDELLYFSLPRRCHNEPYRRSNSEEGVPSLVLATPTAMIWAPTPEPSTRRTYTRPDRKQPASPLMRAGIS